MEEWVGWPSVYRATCFLQKNGCSFQSWIRALGSSQIPQNMSLNVIIDWKIGEEDQTILKSFWFKVAIIRIRVRNIPTSGLPSKAAWLAGTSLKAAGTCLLPGYSPFVSLERFVAALRHPSDAEVSYFPYATAKTPAYWSRYGLLLAILWRECSTNVGNLAPRETAWHLLIHFEIIDFAEDIVPI